MHRGGETTMDVSADLTELGRTPVAVVCAGVKSVLDIPRTLEYLETQARPATSVTSSARPCRWMPCQQTHAVPGHHSLIAKPHILGQVGDEI